MSKNGYLKSIISGWTLDKAYHAVAAYSKIYDESIKPIPCTPAGLIISQNIEKRRLFSEITYTNNLTLDLKRDRE